MCVRLAPEQILQNEEVRKKSFRISPSRHRNLSVPYQKEGYGHDWLITFLNDRLCRVVDCR